MSRFVRLLSENDKATALAEICAHLRAGGFDPRVFDIAPDAFDAVPGKPFAYWASEAVRGAYQRFGSMHDPEKSRFIWSTNPLNDDFRYVRVWWEADLEATDPCWIPWAKGGAFSSVYFDIHTVIHWSKRKGTYFGFLGTINRPLERPASVQHFFRPGITWPRRTQAFGPRVMPRGCIFADKGPAGFVEFDDPVNLLAVLALMISRPFAALVELRLNAGDSTARSFEVGLIQEAPVPDFGATQQTKLATLAREAWSLKRTLDTIEETSHAFLLPAALRSRLGAFEPAEIEARLASLQADSDAIAFDLYGFSAADLAAAQRQSHQHGAAATEEDADEADEANAGAPLDQSSGLLSWAVGVAFGRFDWRLATGERAASPEPDPFDPLPAKSPGMVPNCEMPFHTHSGILVDDPDHPHDLARLIEEVLSRVDALVPGNARGWLQRDFFPLHLKRYSKSRRKAPIYWPLSTPSGSYTLWIYYPSLTSQTLYTAINDFVEPKLKQVGDDVTTLRNKGSGRTRDDEKQFEALQGLEAELLEMRDKLQEIAPGYKPNHDDGVQITAARLWPLFRHKPWQKVLKDTWARLEKGDFDWAHLAMAYWPDRVREKCKTDKSLAIAHGLEDLYVEPEAAPKKTRGRKKAAESE